MGIWTANLPSRMVSDYDSDELFGSSFIVTFRLTYTPTTDCLFEETPRLHWYEKIMMNEHDKNKKRTWEFETDQSKFNPLSNTLKIWVRRYIESYNFACRGYCSHLAGRGRAKLFKKDGALVQAQDLSSSSETNEGDQADAVRSYLKSNGGILEIQIHDIPTIRKRPAPGEATHKERFLLFNVGVEPGPKVQAYQYLVVSPAQRTREHGLGPGRRPRIETVGLTTVPPPWDVSRQREKILMLGECW